MIKFFRKMRQTLLTENKFTKYLIYVFGEIVLVVIGILIALQINNWNEKNTATKKTNTYLDALDTEIESNISSIKGYIVFYYEDIKIHSESLAQLHPENNFYINDSLLKRIVDDTKPIYKPNLIKSTFTDLINSGNLEYLHDEDLKNRILAIEADIDIINETHKHAEDVWEEYQLPYLMKYGNTSGIWDSISSIKIKKLPFKIKADAFVNNNEYANILAERMKMLDNLKVKLIELEKRFSILSNDINTYLAL